MRSEQLFQDAGPELWIIYSFSWFLSCIHKSHMQSLKINPIVVFMVNYPCSVLLVYLGGFSTPRLAWIALRKFILEEKKSYIVLFKPLLILLDDLYLANQSHLL